MKKMTLTCLMLSVMTFTPTLHADLFPHLKIAKGEGSYESGQALCDSIESSFDNRKTTMCDPIYNASNDQDIRVSDSNQRWHTLKPNHWMAYYSDEIYLIDITISNAEDTMIYTEPTTHNDWYGNGLSCNQQSCSQW